MVQHRGQPPVCGCCPEEDVGCELHVDEFAAGGEHPLAPWQEVAGAWVNASHRAQTDDENAILLNTTALPGGVGRFRADSSLDAVGDELRLIGAYVDADNYWFYQFKRRDEFFGEYTLWERSGGVNTRHGAKLIWNLFLFNGYSNAGSLTLCWNGEHITVTGLFLGHRYVPQRWPTTATGGAAIGTGANSGGETRFERTELSKLPDEEDPYCEPCEDVCILVHHDGVHVNLSEEYEVTGSWVWNIPVPGQSAGQIYASGNGKIIAKPTLPPEAEGKGVAYCVWRLGCETGIGGGTPTDADWKARFIVAYTDDDNYAFIERSKKPSGSAAGSVCHSVWRKQAGVETRLTPYLRAGSGQCDGGNIPPIRVCWDGTQICSNITGIDDDDLANSPKPVAAFSDITGDRVGFEALEGNAVAGPPRHELYQLTFWAYDPTKHSIGLPLDWLACGCECEPEYDYPEEPACCEGSPRPEELTVTVFKNGSLFGEFTLFYNDFSLAGNFTYTDNPEDGGPIDDVYILCIQELGHTAPTFNIESEFLSVVLTVLSCEPLHFVFGPESVFGDTWEVEVTQ